MEAQGSLSQQLHPQGQRCVRGQLPQGAALHQLHDDAGSSLQGAHLVDAHHMGVLHPGLEAGLQDQPLGLPGVGAPHELHGHGPLQAPVPGPVDLAHAALAQEPLQLQPAIQRGQQQGHGAPGRARRMRSATSSSSGSA